jgi:pilus assembly protein Flp/PilA
MNTLKQALIDFVREEEGLTVVEYAIAGGLVGLVVVVAFRALGVAVGAEIQELVTVITGN